MGLSCVQRWSNTKKTVSSKVEKTEQVNDYYINEYYSVSEQGLLKGYIGPFKGNIRVYILFLYDF